MTSDTYKSYAKINLYLDVVGKRPDGFHDIETIFQTVSLADRLTFEERPGGLTMECSGADLDCGPTNLVLRAAALLEERAGRARSIHVRLEKRIPVAAGLAGGSGNAAATLVALNALWELGLTPTHLEELALELGSDVPYCLRGGTMAATGRGEIMTPLNSIRDTWFMLVHPPIRVSTAEVFSSLGIEPGSEQAAGEFSLRFDTAIRGLQSGSWSECVFNGMEPFVFGEYPVLSDIKMRLLEAGCPAAAMSGSGPTMFGVCTSRDHARTVSERLDDFRTSVVSSVPSGVVACADSE